MKHFRQLILPYLLGFCIGMCLNDVLHRGEVDRLHKLVDESLDGWQHSIDHLKQCNDTMENTEKTCLNQIQALKPEKTKRIESQLELATLTQFEAERRALPVWYRRDYNYTAPKPNIDIWLFAANVWLSFPEGFTDRVSGQKVYWQPIIWYPSGTSN